MNQPDVSIIIPVYNNERHIRESLESARSQTLSNIEIICVDDGSTDRTAGILREFRQKDSRVVVLHHEKNMGTVMARKTGVKAASGAYIMFLDGDDLLAPECCETALEGIRRLDVDVFWFASEILVLGEEGQITELNRLDPDPETVENDPVRPIDLLHDEGSNFYTLWGKLFRAQMLKNAYSMAEDFHCYLSEDLYGLYLISFSAESVGGEQTKPLYFYHLGRGEWGTTTISLETYKRHCKSSNTCVKIRDFLQRCHFWESEQAYWHRRTRRIAFNSCMEMSRLRPEDCLAGGAIVLQAWGELVPPDEMISIVSRECAERERWAKDLQKAKEWYLSQMDSKDARIQELEAWTGELEGAKSYFEERSKSAEESLQKQKEWCSELEAGKAWLEEQYRAAEAALQQEQARSAQLEAQLRRLLDDKVIRGIVKLRHYDV